MNLQQLKPSFQGELYTDNATLISYATDASVYSQKPLAVAIPKTVEDIEQLIAFAATEKVTLIPRAAGTSLAGQVVGKGLVVDISKHFQQILDFNPDEKWIKVQPGVILDELNRFLAPHNLFFGPEASTANRCTIGGMAGNNAIGLHGVVYGSTRDHVLEVSALLSDGSKVVFRPLSVKEFEEKCVLESLEGAIYRQIKTILSNDDNRKAILENYPDPRLIRRNNGYALDLLLRSAPFSPNGDKLNLSQLICGSEGTLAFITELKLNLVEAPAKNKALVCAHFNTIQAALKANIIALKHKVSAVELMDDIILQASEKNREQQKNRFFVKGNPKGLLMIEFVEESEEKLIGKTKALVDDLKASGLGYHFPVLFGDDTKKAWELRKSGLGIMSNIPGDHKSITAIEDTAVHTDVLPDYIADFTKIMDKYGEDCVYHAHAGTGEIHLRPRLNLKAKADIDKLEKLAWDIAHLVKKYKGSLSGEHGDGRLRGSFTPFMLGDKVYQLLKDLKNAWDPQAIFNHGKITDTPEMTKNLRYQLGETREIETIFDFSEKAGIVRAAESCNGSGDCRKLHTAGGTMCPSYQATLDEHHVTRSRANMLREFLVNSPKNNPFDHKELYASLDLCLSCKACKSECPSSVDMAKLKAEFLQHYYDANGIPLRSRMIANITKVNQLGALIPGITNFVMRNGFTSGLLKWMLKFAPQRSMPLLGKTTLRKFVKKKPVREVGKSKGTVYLFIDEFTNYNDTEIGIATIQLLEGLRYQIKTVPHLESGRTYLSKGLLRKAKNIAIKNVNALHQYITEETPLIGIEPSAILSFRDEYPDLVGNTLKEQAKTLGNNALLVEEFLAREIEKGNITKEQFTKKSKEMKLHGHCQQKAVASTLATKQLLSFPENYSVEEIQSGCCGMAGSFGYEKEHYEISMKVGELVLFPEVRKAPESTTIVAPGTSCRHQINDGTGRKALHPVQVLLEALEG